NPKAVFQLFQWNVRSAQGQQVYDEAVGIVDMRHVDVIHPPCLGLRNEAKTTAIREQDCLTWTKRPLRDLALEAEQAGWLSSWKLVVEIRQKVAFFRKLVSAELRQPHGYTSRQECLTCHWLAPPQTILYAAKSGTSSNV